MKVNVLNVKIDDIAMEEALEICGKWIWQPGKHYIVTPNPEMIVAAQKDEVFRKILNDADLGIPDGKGLRLSGKVKNSFAGTDFMEKLIELCAEKGFTVGFLGGKEKVAKEAAERLKKKNTNLKVIFAEDGGKINMNGEGGYPKLPPLDILFVALGHIKQEKWIFHNLEKSPVHVMMGVGGAFDYFSGRVMRAPKAIRDLGLEWLFRLLIQPWRLKRQLSLFKYLWLTIYDYSKNT